MSDQTTAPTEPMPAPRKRLERSADDRFLGGVAGGLARHFNVDPILFRIGFAVASFIGGIGLFVYFAMYLLVPPEGGKAIVRVTRRTFLIALAVVAAGAAGFALALGTAFASAAGGGTVVAALIIALGVALVAAAFIAGPRARWLVVPALLLAGPATAVAATGFEIEGGVGEETHRPATLDAIPAHGYKLGVGDMKVDLTKLDFGDARDVRVKVKQGVGDLEVVVPDNVCVDADTHAGIGQLDVRGTVNDGLDIDLDEHRSESKAPRIRLDARMGIGDIVVRDSSGRPRNDDDGFQQDRRDRADAACHGGSV